MSPSLSGGRTPVAGARVSVVVSVTDSNAPYLGECLDSLAHQQLRPDEVLLAASVSGADTEALLARAQETATADGLTVTVSAAGLENAVEQAAGRSVMLLEAGDVLPPEVLESLADSLEESGSDLAVLGPRRASGTTLSASPEAAASLDLASMLFRRSLWHEAGLARVRAAAGSWLSAVRALLHASRIDVVPGPVRTRLRRGTGTAFGALPPITPLQLVLPDLTRLLDELESPRLRPVLEHVARWLLADDVADRLQQAESCDPGDWSELVELSRRLTGCLPTGPADGLAVEDRARAWLAAEDRRAELVAFNTARWEDGGDLPTVVRDGAVAAVLPAPDVPLDVRTLSADETPLVTRIRTASWRPGGELQLEVVAFTRLVGRAAGPAEVVVELRSEDGRTMPLSTEAVLSPQVDVLAAERHHDHSDGLYRVRVDGRALAAGGPGSWSFHVAWSRAGVRRQATVRDVDPRGTAADLPPCVLGGVELRLADARLHCGPARARVGAAAASEVTDLVLEDDVLVVSGVLAPDAGPGLKLRLRGRRGTTVARLPAAGSAFTVRLPLRHDPWGLGEAPLPPGGYRLRLRARDGSASPLRLGGEAAARAPYAVGSDAFRMDVERAPDGSPHLGLGAPLADDEVGLRAQQELRRWYVEQDRPCDPGAVYLQAYQGQITDSPLAIHRELRRSRPDLRLVWAVADSSVTVPDGAERVVVRSREWYSALATCGHVVTNVDMGAWFRKRPGQRLLQTSHGYPSKAVGVMEWEAKNFTAGMIESQLRRTAGTWDLLLSPDPGVEGHLREQYRYDGEILSAGSPRDDELLAPDAARRREMVRDRLGVGERTAVLYAPTWRDDLTTGHRAAVLPPTFDVAAAAEALGDDFVILLRGHRFHRQRRVSGQVVDVTDYPEVNHLLLAADVGVLDYSSLRFDLALTGRPMIFLVPDLDRYERRTRGFLYDFRSSAPGPLLSTTGEVVEALRDLPGVAREHEAAYRRFNRRFNSRQDGRAAERVVQAFFAPAGGARRC